MPSRIVFLIIAVIAISAQAAWAAGGEGHGEVTAALLALSVMLFAGKLGGALAQRLRQPGVLGELLAGVVIGNFGLFGFHGLDFLRHQESIVVMAEIGVILLLFSAGLESTVAEMLSVGKSSLLVATLGVLLPTALGWGVARLLIPEQHPLGAWFIGATLCATSVGITARVLQDLGKLQIREARVVLGAAAIDDVLGLLILAVVAGIIEATAAGSTLAFSGVAVIAGKALGFLAAAIFLGPWVSLRLFRVATLLGTRGLLLPTALVFCFAMSYLAAKLGLAPIVGAFAAGLVLEDVHYKDLEKRDEHELEEALHPLLAMLAPIFFVIMGMGVDLRSFASLDVLALAGALTVAAVAGKMVCGWGVLEPGLNRLAIAVGMVPRGEVGLIFAAIGAKLVLDGHPIIESPVYSAVVVMVAVTTLVTPPILKIVLERGAQRQGDDSTPEVPAV
jgi:Kef-type K+ transport system membrane component KefB